MTELVVIRLHTLIVVILINIFFLTFAVITSVKIEFRTARMLTNTLYILSTVLNLSFIGFAASDSYQQKVIRTKKGYRGEVWSHY
jgi:hypothetical protein